ncbi:MAG: hypothetical protein ACOX2K_00130 [Bacillota bacterium]|jgi:predicted nucleotidyltransferase
MLAKQKSHDLQTILMRQLTDRYGTMLRAVLLIGSQARGDAKPFSDVNLLALTAENVEHIFLFPRGELAQVVVKPLALFMAELYAPEGRQVTDWWLLAGDVQQAIPWHDPAGVLPIAQRMIEARLPRVELYGRILWEKQLEQLSYHAEEMLAAEPWGHAYLGAAAHFADQAEALLRIYHGRVLPKRSVNLLPRPKSFLSDWAALWCLGTEPMQVDMGAAADAVGQIVRGIWREGYHTLAELLPPHELAARQQALDRAPGSGELVITLPVGYVLSPELMDRCIGALWATVKYLLQRQPVELLTEVQRLQEILDQAGLMSGSEQLEGLLRGARVPPGADPARVAQAVERIRQGLLDIKQTPLILPQRNRR